jgi:hypothetical protein
MPSDLFGSPSAHPKLFNDLVLAGSDALILHVKHETLDQQVQRFEFL